MRMSAATVGSTRVSPAAARAPKGGWVMRVAGTCIALVGVVFFAVTGQALAAPNPQNMHAPVVTRAAAPVTAAAAAIPAYGVISNGTVRLGINPAGHLDVDTPDES